MLSIYILAAILFFAYKRSGREKERVGEIEKSDYRVAALDTVKFTAQHSSERASQLLVVDRHKSYKLKTSICFIITQHTDGPSSTPPP